MMRWRLMCLPAINPILNGCFACDSAFCFSDSGRSGTRNAKSALPPLDSGILGGYIAPDNLTTRYRWVTHCLMSALALRHRCEKVAEDDAFSQRLAGCGVMSGDVLLQICANTQDTVIHALPISSNIRQICSACAGSGKGLFRSRGA